MAPQTVAAGIAEGILAVPLSEPTDVLETCLVWRGDDRSPAVASFVAVARSVFGPTLTGSV
jgi:DNA-binding transcriptional LysR family regulator